MRFDSSNTSWDGVCVPLCVLWSYPCIPWSCLSSGPVTLDEVWFLQVKIHGITAQKTCMPWLHRGLPCCYSTEVRNVLLSQQYTIAPYDVLEGRSHQANCRIIIAQLTPGPCAETLPLLNWISATSRWSETGQPHCLVHYSLSCHHILHHSNTLQPRSSTSTRSHYAGIHSIVELEEQFLWMFVCAACCNWDFFWLLAD